MSLSACPNSWVHLSLLGNKKLEAKIKFYCGLEILALLDTMSASMARSPTLVMEVSTLNSAEGQSSINFACGFASKTAGLVGIDTQSLGD